jgi:ribosomal protein S27AE
LRRELLSLEPLRCTECGSPDVTAFKPGTYVCGHCETVFKLALSPGPGSVAAVCEVEECGVGAVGRCGRCGEAFCTSHQARLANYPYTIYVDQCAACLARSYQSAIVAAKSEYDAVVTTLMSFLDPVERLLTAIGCYGPTISLSSWSGSGGNGLGADFVRQLWPAGDWDIDKNPPWDSAEVALWFAGRASSAGLPATGDAVEFFRKWRQPMFGKGRFTPHAPVPAWAISEGSTLYKPETYGFLGGYATAFILQDGSLLPSDHGLRGYALAEMAKSLGLKPPPAGTA